VVWEPEPHLTKPSQSKTWNSSTYLLIWDPRKPEPSEES
jgi:hypothetical protein